MSKEFVRFLATMPYLEECSSLLIFGQTLGDIPNPFPVLRKLVMH